MDITFTGSLDIVAEREEAIAIKGFFESLWDTFDDVIEDDYDFLVISEGIDEVELGEDERSVKISFDDAYGLLISNDWAESIMGLVVVLLRRFKRVSSLVLDGTGIVHSGGGEEQRIICRYDGKTAMIKECEYVELNIDEDADFDEVIEAFYEEHMCDIDSISEEIIDKNRGRTVYIDSARGVMSDEDVFTDKPSDYWRFRDDLTKTF